MAPQPAASLRAPARDDGVAYPLYYHYGLGGYGRYYGGTGSKTRSSNLNNDVRGHIRNDHLVHSVTHGIYGYVCRKIAGTSKWSTHAWGIAVDDTGSTYLPLGNTLPDYRWSFNPTATYKRLSATMLVDAARAGARLVVVVNDSLIHGFKPTDAFNLSFAVSLSLIGFLLALWSAVSGSMMPVPGMARRTLPLVAVAAFVAQELVEGTEVDRLRPFRPGRFSAHGADVYRSIEEAFGGSSDIFIG